MINTVSSHRTIAMPSLDQLREILRDARASRESFIAKYGHEPIYEIRTSSSLRGIDNVLIIGGVAFVSEDVFLSIDTVMRFDAWMTRLESGYGNLPKV